MILESDYFRAIGAAVEAGREDGKKVLTTLLTPAGVKPDRAGRLLRRRRVLDTLQAWFLFNTGADPVEEFSTYQRFPFLFCTGFHGRGSRRRGGDGGCDRSLNLIPGESGDFRSSADTRPPRRKALPEATAGFLRRHSICSSRFPDRLFELPDETESRSKPLLQIREARGENAHPREHDRQRDNDDQDTEQKERHHGAPVRVGNTNAGRSYAKIVFSYRRINEEGGPVPLFPHILAYSSHTQYI